MKRFLIPIVALFLSPAFLHEAKTQVVQSMSTCYVTSAASNNATNCKAVAGNVYGIYVTNTTSTIYYLRMYNLAATPTCSSATGFVESIPGQALGVTARNQTLQTYSNGIGFCITAAGTSTDNTNAATGVYVTILYN